MPVSTNTQSILRNAVTTALFAAASVTVTTPSLAGASSDTLEEIVVTAQRRE